MSLGDRWETAPRRGIISPRVHSNGRGRRGGPAVWLAEGRHPLLVTRTKAWPPNVFGTKLE